MPELNHQQFKMIGDAAQSSLSRANASDYERRAGAAVVGARAALRGNPSTDTRAVSQSLGKSFGVGSGARRSR